MSTSTPLITFMKTIMMVFNFIFWVTGVAVLALGIWMKVQLYMYIELTTEYYTEAPYVLIGTGCGIIIIGFLACMCTSKGKPVLIYMFAGFLFVVFIAELAVGIAGFVYRNKIQDGFSTGLTNALDNYGTDETAAEAFDGIQSALNCCGKDGYADWFAVAWSGQLTNGVPASCCIEEGCANNPANGTVSTDVIHTEGCYTLVTSFMRSNFAIIGGVAVGFAFIQFFGSLLACCLAKNINKNKYEQVA